MSPECLPRHPAVAYLFLVRRMHVSSMKRATLLLLALSSFIIISQAADVPPRAHYDAAKIAAEPDTGWLPDLKPYKSELRACFAGDIAAFLKLEKIAPDGDGECQDSRLLWLVLHIWGDTKFSKFLASQPEHYRQLTSRGLRWTYDEGDWHHPIPTDKLEAYIHSYFPKTWRLVAAFPKPTMSSTPPP